MKKKIFSILFALVLVVSMSLVTAVPAAAVDPGDVELSTVCDGTAEWATEQAHSGSYSVKFHAENWGEDGFAVGIPVDIPLNEIAELSYWRNGVSFPAGWDYAPPAVLLCIDANNDGKLDFGTQEALEVMFAWEKSSLLGDDAILGIEGDWVETDIGWIKVDVLAKSWLWGGAWWFDKTGWSGWVTCPSLQVFTGFGTSDTGYPCPIDPTDNVMLVAIAGGNPDGDVYVDDITVNEVMYDLEPAPATKADILKDSGVPGKGLDKAPGLQKPFNPDSKAGEHAGKK